VANDENSISPRVLAPRFLIGTKRVASERGEILRGPDFRTPNPATKFGPG
jgi:hypothetical protein